MSYDLKLFTGNANRPLAEEIAQYLRVPVADAEVTRFSDGEVYVQVNENVRGADVFVIQPTCPPVNDTLMELLIMIDALKRASAHRITAVLPYYGYARQDRKVQPRVPISAKLVADLLEAAGVDREGARRILACGVHAVLSGPAIDRIKASPIEEVVVTNSIAVSPEKRVAGRVTVLTVAPLLGEAIRRIHDEESVSTLFV